MIFFILNNEKSAAYLFVLKKKKSFLYELKLQYSWKMIDFDNSK